MSTVIKLSLVVFALVALGTAVQACTTHVVTEVPDGGSTLVMLGSVLGGLTYFSFRRK